MLGSHLFSKNLLRVALEKLNKEMGLAFDEHGIQFKPFRGTVVYSL